MKYTFYVSNQGVNVYQYKQHIAELTESFTWSAFQELDEFIARLPSRAAVSIVLDLVEEDISIEAFPKLYLWERNSVRDRHIQQIMADGSEFVHTRWTGQVQTSDDGRMEEFMLTSSITSPANLVNFMASIEEAQVLVEGLYSASFLLAEYFKDELSHVFELTKQELSSPFFLVSRQSEHSYRQTFFNQSGIRISRLIEIDKRAEDYEGLKSALVHETKLAKNYIYNQNIIEADTEISYIFMDGDPKRLEGLKQLSIDEHLILADDSESKAFFKTLVFSPETEGDNDIRPKLDEHYAARELACYIFRVTPSSFYSTPYTTKIKQMLMGYRAMLGINSLALAGLLIFLSVSAIDWYISQDKLERLQQSIISHEYEKERLQKEVALQVDAEEIKASVEFSEAILKLKTDRTVGFDIKPVSDVVAKHEHIQVLKLDWYRQGAIDGKIYEVEFFGWVFPFEDYFREPVEWVDAFRQDLEKVEVISDVRLIQEPLNRNLKQALTVNINNNEETVDALPFQIKMKVRYEQSK